MKAVFRRWLAVLVVALLAAACTSGSPTAKGPSTTTGPTRPISPTTTTTLPTVLTSVTPAGWVAVDYGNAQLSVPGDWKVGYDLACLDLGPPGAIYVGRSGYGYCPFVAASTAPMVSVAPLPRSEYPSAARAGPPRTVNGIQVWGRVTADGVGRWTVPALGVSVVLDGAAAQDVLATLTRSPAAVVLAPGAAPSIPGSWTWRSEGFVRFAVPRDWPATTSDVEGPECGNPTYVAPKDQLVVDSDAFSGFAIHCPDIPYRPPLPQRPTDGLVVDLHPRQGWPPSAKLGTCLQLHGLTACLYDRTPTASEQMAELDILFVRVSVPGHAGQELLEIGLAGDGTVARTILYSLRAV